ncbi:MAG: hypothetical protein Q8P67_21730 [archaeon]|nr:hypothetical protein [archaeon]
MSAVSVTAEVETHEEAMQQYEVEYQAFREAAKGEHSVELVAPAIWRNLEFPKAVMDEEGKPRPVCMTDRLWQAAAPFYKKIGVMLENGCKGESICDQPEVRDAYLPTADGHKTTVDVAFHVICESETKCPSGMNLQRVIDQMQTLNDDFHTANVFFSLDESRVFFHVNPTYSTIAAYGLLPTWLNQIRALKKQYAYEPASYLNIFVTGQKQGLLGTLLGIGTFPWDPEALTEYGGLWVNAEFCGGNQRTLSHEAGHNVGLWHSFHGVEEVGKCGSPCYEEPHPLGDQNANYVGGLFIFLDLNLSLFSLPHFLFSFFKIFVLTLLPNPPTTNVRSLLVLPATEWNGARMITLGCCTTSCPTTPTTASSPSPSPRPRVLVAISATPSLR